MSCFPRIYLLIRHKNFPPGRFLNFITMSGVYYFLFLKGFAYFNGTKIPNKYISTTFSKTCLESNLDIAPPSLSANESLGTKIHNYIVFRYIAAP